MVYDKDTIRLIGDSQILLNQKMWDTRYATTLLLNSLRDNNESEVNRARGLLSYAIADLNVYLAEHDDLVNNRIKDSYTTVEEAGFNEYEGTAKFNFSNEIK